MKARAVEVVSLQAYVREIIHPASHRNLHRPKVTTLRLGGIAQHGVQHERHWFKKSLHVRKKEQVKVIKAITGRDVALGDPNCDRLYNAAWTWISRSGEGVVVVRALYSTTTHLHCDQQSFPANACILLRERTNIGQCQGVKEET